MLPVLTLYIRYQFRNAHLLVYAHSNLGNVIFHHGCVRVSCPMFIHCNCEAIFNLLHIHRPSVHLYMSHHIVPQSCDEFHQVAHHWPTKNVRILFLHTDNNIVMQLTCSLLSRVQHETVNAFSNAATHGPGCYVVTHFGCYVVTHFVADIQCRQPFFCMFLKHPSIYKNTQNLRYV